VCDAAVVDHEIYPDDELVKGASALGMTVRVNQILLDRYQRMREPGFYTRDEREWRDDTYTFMALQDSVWIRGRSLIQFVLNKGRPDVVMAQDYLPGWELTGPLRTPLEFFYVQSGQIVAHILRDPGTEAGLYTGMPGLVVQAFGNLLEDAPDGHVLHAALDEMYSHCIADDWYRPPRGRA
jgi:hypothetical protein